MQAATSAAPTRRSRLHPKPEGNTAETEQSEAQAPGLVSQLQARFDALALSDAQQHSGSSQAADLGTDIDELACSTLQHEPTLLILDGALQAMPWESVPSTRNCRSYV